MTKKTFLVLSVIFALFFSTSYSFAISNNIQEGMNNAGDEMKDSWDKLGNTVQNVGNAVKTGVNNIGNTLMGNESDNNDTVYMGMNDDNGNYTATRTSTDSTVLGMDSTMWTWLIIAIVGITVISLVWYYGKQNTVNSRNHQD